MTFQTKLRLNDTKAEQIAGVNLTLSGNTTIASGGTIQYAENVHGDYVDRSLVDKEYVDDAVGTISTAALTGATNGLTADGQDVKLGGTLTESTTIDGDEGAYAFTVNQMSSIILGTQQGQFITIDGSGTNELIQIDTGSVRITLDGETNNATIGSPTAGFAGLEYTADYSGDYTLRSLPDVDYVTGLTSQIESDIEDIQEITDVALTGATNGLTKDGRNVKLGGDLTEATTISGEGNNLTITGIDALTLSASTVNVDGTINIVEEPTEITTEDFSVLVRDDTTGEVKVVDGDELGEDNNDYNIEVYTINDTLGDEYVALINGATNMTLPAAVEGKAYKIKDISGDALTNPITISGTIDGESNAVINTDYGAIELVSDGTAWFVLSFVN